MVHLPQANQDDARGGGGCGSSCGAGLEKIYPSTAVRYGAMRWIGEFTYKPGTVFKCGAKVVIQTDRGVELGEQVSLTCNGCEKSVSREQIKAYVQNSGPEFYRLRSGRILREATADDLNENQRLNARVREDISQCALVAARMSLDMKVITAEHLLGGERVVYYFRADDRVDFRDLVREMAQHHKTRIEMRQVGARDEARLVADYEICGRECCCKNFLKKLRPVTMKMAKLQKSTLDPSKVSGRCGRLRCCLRYEHEGYESLAAKLPPPGTWVETEFGVARVLDGQVLTQLVLVQTTDARDITIPIEEIKAFNVKPPERPPAPPEAPGERREPRPPRRPRGERRPLYDPAAEGEDAGARTRPEGSAPGAESSDRVNDAGGEPDRPERRKRRRPLDDSENDEGN